MNRKFLIFLVLLLVSTPAFAQSVDTAWVRRYNGTGGIDRACAIAVDDLGCVYVTGVSYGQASGYDYVTIKYHPNGDTAWVRRFNGPGNGEDQAWAIAADGSGNSYVTGWSLGDGTNLDYATIKYYPDGDTAWVRRYDGTGSYEDRAYGIAIDGSGNVYVTGYSGTSNNFWDYVTIKYNPSGATAWSRRYNGTANLDDAALAIDVDDSGYVYVTGWSYGSGTQSDYVTIKYHQNGDILWVRRYDGPGNAYDFASALASDYIGNVYVTGITSQLCAGGDYITVKYHPNGEIAWAIVQEGPGVPYERLPHLVTDGSGHVYLSGYVNNEVTHEDFLSIKYHPNAGIAWMRQYRGPGQEIPCDITTDAHGNAYVTGYSFPNPGSGTPDHLTIKYNQHGEEIWAQRYDGPINSSDHAWAIAVDDSNNVYVTGDSEGFMSGADYLTIKYRQQNHSPETFSLLFPTNKAFTPRGVRFDWETADDLDTLDRVRYDLYVSTSYHFPPGSTTVVSDLMESEHARILNYGTHYWKVKAKDENGAETWCNQMGYFMVTDMEYVAGDFNGDGSVDGGDVVHSIGYLFRWGPAPDPLESGDVNCDERVDSGDVVFLIIYLFRDGPTPSCEEK
jgi:hypothetical protein